MRFHLMMMLLALGLISPAAHAHKLKLFITLDGDRLSGQTYYVDGGPAPATSVKLLNKDGQTITQILSDADGYFRLPLPGRGEVMVEADAGPGHVDHVHLEHSPVTTENTAENTSAPEAEHLSLGVIQHQLDGIQEQLRQHDQRTRLFDIFGAFGYILFMVAVVILWRLQQQRRQR
ncbi:carboxypeptidase-like regulatory domain-containing protein [Pokkaliibacter sp. CJK22405]|uniref:carboxypeptidase-like regulatory domain-containing protein n=1 Tax=Pokkaliibacter sp. CJK22405 TaxID=3384615 RepID=UPI0039847402